MKIPSADDLAEAATAVVVGGAMAMHPGAPALLAGVSAVAPMVAGKFAGMVGRYGGDKDGALLRAYKDSATDWLVRWTAEVPRVIEAQRRLSERVEDLDARLAERIDDREFQRVIDNFGVEATREAIDDRRRMLAHATANAFNLAVTVAEAARAERVLRELDPDDVIALQDFRAGQRDADSPYAAAGLETLIAAGCVTGKWETRSGWGGSNENFVTFSMTKTGALLLRLVSSYKRPDPAVP